MSTSDPQPTTEPVNLMLTVNVTKLNTKGRDLEFTAQPDDLQKLAVEMKVAEMKDMTVLLHVEKAARGINVSGRLTATAVQPCVVTLEPVTQQINVPIDRLFLPARMRVDDPAPGSESFVDLSGDDLPDYYEDEVIDLTPLVLETLGMEIDLYPRAPDAKIPLDDASDEKENPFAVLAKLKKH